MNVKELFLKHNFEDLFQNVKEIHPKAEKINYAIAWNSIRNTKPTAFTEFTVCLETQVDCDSKKYNHVFGIKDDPKFRYALYCTDWSEWLKMKVDDNTIEEFGEIVVLAHILFEMTYRGYYKTEINKTIHEIEKVMEKCNEI